MTAACLALLACAEPPPECAPADRGSPVAHPSVVRVRNNRGTCTGVVTAAGVLTSAHCTRDVTDLWVQLGDGTEHDVAAVRAHPTEDVALLVMAPGFPAPAVPLAAYTAEPGDSVSLVGYGCSPGYAAQLSRTGRVESAGTRIRADVCGCPGDSGGALLSESGELLGVLWGGTGEFVLAIDVYAILD